MFREIYKRLVATANSFFTIWPELPYVAIALVVFWGFGWAIRLFDPNAMTIDAAALQLILFGMIKTLIASMAAWLLLRFQFKGAYRTLVQHVRSDFENLNAATCKRLIIGLSLYALYFLAFVLAM